MQDIVELERRITAALQRITLGVDRLAETQGGGGLAAELIPDMAPDMGDHASGEIARLAEALDEERMANAQLTERLRKLREQVQTDAAQTDAPLSADPAPVDNGLHHAASAEISTLKAHLAEQSDEISTLRRVLAEAGKEIANLRAARAQEAEELGDILGALDPLLRAAHEEAPHA